MAFRVICANQTPDHTTIARFRRSSEQALADCFIEVLKLCQAAGLLRVGLVALDGTKIEANASIGANRTLPQIESEVARMLEEASRTDAEEDERLGPARGDELPSELKDRRSRLARLAECKARLQDEAASREAAYQAHLARRAVIEAERGRPLRGRKPVLKGPRSSTSARANTTDPDSRIMKAPRGFIQGYNAQAVVTEDQIVLAAAVTHEANDRRQPRPMLNQTEANLAQTNAGPVGVLVADAGYWNERELAGPGKDSVELLVATQESRGRMSTARTSPTTPVKAMERKLRTKRGRRLFQRRAQIVEPIFGEIKGPRRATRFMRRGITACDAEWKLLCTTNNLLKLWRARSRPPR